MIYTDYLPDPDIQYTAGYSMIGVIVVLMVVYLIYVIKYGVKAVILISTKYYRRIKRKICGKEI